MMSEVKEPLSGDVVVMNFPHEDLLKHTLCKQYNETGASMKVKEVQEVVPMGENYMSSLHRVIIEIYKGEKLVKEKILIVKAFPKSELTQMFIKKANIFQTELTTYIKVLPELNRIASEMLGKPAFSANSYDTGVDDLLVMEDLKLDGFKMADRHVGLDFEHCKVAIRALARFHAISMYKISVDETFPSVIPQGLFRKEGLEGAERLFRPKYAALAGVVESWPGFERFGDKLRSAGMTASQKVIELNDIDNTDMVVLNHGDFWLNNMLFNYSDSGVVEDIRFVDFQLTRFTSPAMDLHYFFTSTPNDDVREDGISALLQVYYTEFCRTLEVLGCDKRVTFDWLKKEMKDKMFYALHVSCVLLNIIVAEPSDTPEELSPISNDSGLDQSYARSCNGRRFRQIMEKLLLKFEKEGVL